MALISWWFSIGLEEERMLKKNEKNQNVGRGNVHVGSKMAGTLLVLKWGEEGDNGWLEKGLLRKKTEKKKIVRKNFLTFYLCKNL